MSLLYSDVAASSMLRLDARASRDVGGVSSVRAAAGAAKAARGEREMKSVKPLAS